jgi:hypothetical protein
MGLRNFVLIVTNNLQVFIDEDVPLVLICKVPDVGKHLMSRQDNLLDIVGDFRDVIGQCLCYRSFNGTPMENLKRERVNFLRRDLFK